MAKTRDSKPVEELDVAAWAEAALVFQANTLAEKEQFAMQQNASIARLQAGCREPGSGHCSPDGYEPIFPN